MSRNERSTSDSSAGRAPKSTPERVRVSELFKGARELILEHGDQDYRLRITAAGKLILTK
jgi:hemin uptake protein HemP